jgi:hypothetical protein
MDSRKLSKDALLEMLEVDLGFIYEVVVSTCDAYGKPNAAPMGIQFVADVESHGDKRVLLRPFKSTTTYKNLSSRGEAVINVTSDPEVFYKTLVKHEGTKPDTLKNIFQLAKTVKPPRIRGSDAYIEVSAQSSGPATSNEGERADILCEIKLVQVDKPTAKLYCRAPHALIETMIHASRVKELFSEGSIEEANHLLELMDHYRSLIHRVAPSSHYETMADAVIKAYSSVSQGGDSTVPKKRRKTRDKVGKDQS